jgi:antitoxin ParD1/3/4
MDVSLTPELEELIDQKVKSGLYNSASEVIREGLRLLKEQDELVRLRQEELRREVLKGYEQAQRGESRPLDVEAVKAEGRKRRAS